MGWRRRSNRVVDSLWGPLVQVVGVVAPRRLWSSDTARLGGRSRLRRGDRGCGRSRRRRSRPSRRCGWPRGCRRELEVWRLVE
jgi:hypothetical protein